MLCPTWLSESFRVLLCVFVCLYLCRVCTPARRSQSRVLGLLELELQVVESYCYGCRDLNWVFWPSYSPSCLFSMEKVPWVGC